MEDIVEIENNTAKEKGCWTKFSEVKLIELERKILDVVKTSYKGWFVPIGPHVGEDDKIWTLALNTTSKNTPLVMLHGFAAGVGFWCLNLDAIAKSRPVYAVDLLGFGRSSRPNFSSNHQEAESQMIEAVEQWRVKMNLDKFILIGHSFGGYLATGYTLKYPERVKHLILADPWGFYEKPADFNVPLWIKAIAVPLSRFNPLATVRAAGPMGPWLVRNIRSDIARKYTNVFERPEIIAEYIYQCNSRKPTGESAFHSLIKDFAFPKDPMVNRMDQLHENVPITILYGKESWVNRTTGDIIKSNRESSYVNIEVVEGAGHHIYADQPDAFNNLVSLACHYTDEMDVNNMDEEEDGVKISENEKMSTNDDEIKVPQVATVA